MPKENSSEKTPETNSQREYGKISTDHTRATEIRAGSARYDGPGRRDRDRGRGSQAKTVLIFVP